MLTTRSDAEALLRRLSAVPGAVQASAATAVTAYVRARTSGVSKAQAIKTYGERARAQRLHPDAAEALARFVRPASPFKAAARPDPGGAAAPEPSPAAREALLARLQQAAVQGALKALGRSS